MTDPDVTIIAMLRQIPLNSLWFIPFWLGLCFVTIGAHAALRSKFIDRWPFTRENLRPLAVALAVPLLCLWLCLFLLAVWTALAGISQLLEAPPKGSVSATSGLGSLGLGALLAALLGGPFVIWGTYLKHRTVNFQKEGHLTDRIAKAVEQLGAEKTVKVPKLDGTGSEERTLPNIEVRIGGILSLERIAQDSTAYDKGRDHVRCMEILCAYIRENAKAKDAKDHDLGDWQPLKDDPTEAEREAHLEKRNERFGDWHSRSKAYLWAQALREPRADIAQALLVIGRRTKEQRRAEARWGKDASPTADWVYDTACPILPDAEKGRATTGAKYAAYYAKFWAWKVKIEAYKGYRLDLRKTNLQRADLSDFTLSAARLNGARMEGANLSGARMEGAVLSEARMEGANLRKVRMEGADLKRARMEGAALSEARMEGANLQKVRMEGADLNRARMEAADLTEARMEGAYLSLVRMEGAGLREAQMAGASLSGVRMEGADLHAARLVGAGLQGTRMEGADLGEARMQGADLRLARMDEHTSLILATLQGAALRQVDCSNVSLSPDQIKSSFGDASVILPNGITPDHRDWPAHWPKTVLNGAEFVTQWRKWLASPSTYTPPSP